MPGYKDWISDIDIKIDYYSAFMKAWIAFNAWYNNSGEIEGNTDADRIEKIAYSNNRFKTYIINLIDAENSEGVSYRGNIAKLHEALQGAAMVTQEYVGTRQAISFSNVAVKNRNSRERIEYYGCCYECSRSRGRVITRATRNGNEFFHYEQDEYSEDDLTQQSSFKQLSATRQRVCIDCYRKMQPYKTETILDASGNEKNGCSKKIGIYNFINDSEKIGRSIVLILYMLRCCLAHGDFSPDSRSNEVYKYAYEVLCAPLKKLL